MIPPEMLAALRLGAPVYCDWVYFQTTTATDHPHLRPYPLRAEQHGERVTTFLLDKPQVVLGSHTLTEFKTHTYYHNFRFNP